MAQAYSMDLRERVLKDCDAGMRSEDVASKYTVSASWVYDLRKKRRETGNIAPEEYKRGAKLKLAPYEQEVRQLVTDHPDATLEELHAMLPNKDEVTIVTLHNFLVRLKITWKKRFSIQNIKLATESAFLRSLFVASRLTAARHVSIISWSVDILFSRTAICSVTS